MSGSGAAAVRWTAEDQHRPIPVTLIFALSTHDVDNAIFHVASALQVPVLVLALLALAATIFELGSFAVELQGRRRRTFGALLQSTDAARAALDEGDRAQARRAVSPLTRNPAMAATLDFIVGRARTPGSDNQLNKALADFDLESQRRLGRTRMLVRFGPALGLMGTLIPLSPALTGLADGNTTQLSHDLRVAFSVTVVGLLIGAVAFAISLSRDRLYSQDLSDLQYVAAVVSDPALVGAPAAGLPTSAPSPAVIPPPAAASTTSTQPPS
jgi:biopolymer transport protein ExbB/TolQ